MVKKNTSGKGYNVICFSLGGHIATQNTSFKELARILEPEGYSFYGAKDGFKAFETGDVYKLNFENIPKDFAGFVAGAGRASLTHKDGSLDENKLDRAVDFFKKGKFDIAIGSGGDDHGMQMESLRKGLEDKLEVYVLNKTMDNDLGGKKSYTDFTNGFHTAVSVGVNSMKNHFAGAWTNNMPYLICPFGRDANWVGIAMSYFGHADKFIYRELPDGHLGHDINEIHDLILDSQQKNDKDYRRRFSMIVVAEGTRIRGIDHTDKKLVDAHGHHKLNPEALVSSLKRELQIRYGMQTQTVGITYEMRNSPPTKEDIYFAKMSANALVKEIQSGNSGAESVFKIIGVNGLKDVVAGVAPIEKVSEKRFALYHPKPFIDYQNFEVTEEIGKYYQALFGERNSLSKWLPIELKPVKVDSLGQDWARGDE